MAVDDTLLSNNDIEEQMSFAYVQAVASAAGYTFSIDNKDVNGIDIRIHAGGSWDLSIGLQLKATTRLGAPSADGHFRYKLEIKDYRRLIRGAQYPKYLVVLDLPGDKDDWLTVSDDELIIRRCAYWVSLYGCSERDNRRSVTVSIPSHQRFDPEALQSLVQDARNRARIDDDGR